METRMCAPVKVRSETGVTTTRVDEAISLPEPLLLTLLKYGQHQPQPGLRKSILELSRRSFKLSGAVEAFDEALSWAQGEHAAGRLGSIAACELAAVRLCTVSQPDLFLQMNQALSDERQLATWAVQDETVHWSAFAGWFSAGLAKLPRDEAPPTRLFRTTWVETQLWQQHFAGQDQNAVLCFTGAQSAGRREYWPCPKASRPGCQLCVFEFVGDFVHSAACIKPLSASNEQEDEWFLPPYMQAVVESIETEQAPGNLELEVSRIRVRGLRATEPLPQVLNGSAERILAGALLVGLNVSTPQADDVLLRALNGFFQSLAAAVEVKNSEATSVVWKGYWECFFEDLHSWQELNESVKSGVVSAARMAASDLISAAKGVTQRFLGFESAMNHEAMEIERERLVEEMEHLKKDAVAAARDQVIALQLETMTDPEAFLRFLQLDPVKAFEAAPAAASAWMAAAPAQKVLLLAKLMGLIAVAAGLLQGDAKVQAAFVSPLPLNEDVWHTLLDAIPNLHGDAPSSREAAAQKAIAFLQLQRLCLARCRLLIVGGAPDTGKTTLLREVFGLEHLQAGLSRNGRTEQVSFNLHPHGDRRYRPVYLVDTPGFGDGENLHCNDMDRLLQGVGGWIPGGVTLLWVMRAGRAVKQEAHELLRGFFASHVPTVVVITHIDQLFEERYREVGPQWREGPLRGVSRNDERWREHRRGLMAEIHEEIAAGLRSAIGVGQIPELVYACLAGWMVPNEAEEDDDFSAVPPWPWAKQELTAFYGILSKSELRKLVDTRLGLDPERVLGDVKQ